MNARRVGKLLTAAGLAACLMPAGASALETRRLDIATPAARDCTAGLLPADTAGVARERWTAPAEGYLTLRLGGDPYAPDWDLAARGAGMDAASTNSGSAERVNLWVEEGDRIAIQACRLEGGARRVPLTIDLHEMAIPDGDGERISQESVAIDSPADERALERLGFDVTHAITPDRAEVVLYSDAERARLARSGFGFETVVYDLAAADAAHLRRSARRETRSDLPSRRDSYRVYADYTSEMKDLAAQHPGHVRSITIGTTLEGRPIEAVEIAGNVNATDDGRPVYLNLGTHHAREWPSGEFPMEFAIDLARGYGADARITSMLDRVRVIIVPVVNADGFVASRSFGTSPLDDSLDATLPQIATGTGAYRRKNCRGVSPADQAVPCASRTTGVDLNRNYGAYWGGPGSSSDPVGPGAQIYRGAGPYSEPESQAVLALSESVHPTVVISNHTFTEDGKWLRQPGFNADFMPQDFTTGEAYREGCDGDTDGALTPDEPAMRGLGNAMASATGWTSELGYETLCDITGATEDWNYLAQGAYGYTPEARGPNFHANYASMVVNEYLGDGSGGVREAFLRAGEEAADTDNHGVIEGAAPPGASLRLQKDFELPTCDGELCEQGDGEPVDYAIDTRLNVPADGTYTWHVNQSTRPDVYSDRNPPREAWTMTCKRPNQPRSVAQQVLIDRGDRVSVDWTSLCGSDGSGGDELPHCIGKPISIIDIGERSTIIGTKKADVIYAGDGADRIRPGKGKDTVCGAGGKDSMKGGGGADTLIGQVGGDSLAGGNGNDTLRGGAGKDRLTGNKGRNRCIGGSGKDAFKRGC